MKAFVAAVAVMILIAIGANCYLGGLGFSSSETYATENVRLGN